MHQDLLYVIAQVAITLAGFSGVVYALGQRTEGQFTNTERNGLFHLLFTTCGNMLVVLVVAALISFSVSENTAWRIGCFCMGLFVVAGSIRAIIEQLQGEHSLPKLLAWPVPTIAIILATANIVIALGYFVEIAPNALISLSLFILFTSVAYFTSLLVPETTQTNK